MAAAEARAVLAADASDLRAPPTATCRPPPATAAATAETAAAAAALAAEDASLSPALKFGAFAEAATTRSSAATTSATLAPPLPPALARVAGCQPAGPAVRDSRPFGGARRWLRQRSACCAPSRPISCGVDGVGAPRARRRRRRAPPGWGCWVVASPERPGGARWRALAPAARARRAGTTGTAGYRA